jgi:hypothetical protein
MKAIGLTLLVLGAGLLACVADRGPSSGVDGGGDAADAAADSREVGSSCKAHPGGNDLSFDIVCKNDSCDVDAHIDFHIDKSNKAYPGCGDGPKNFDLLDVKTGAPLSGSENASLRMGITGYAGPASYSLEPTSTKPAPFFDLSATPSCEKSKTPASIPPLLIEQTPPASSEGGLTDAAVIPPPSCEVNVDSDCTNGDGTHNVTGTMSCSFPSPGGGWSCNLTHGKFQFDDCLP